VPLGEGCSLLDWSRLADSGADLSGTKGRILRVPLSEVKVSATKYARRLTHTFQKHKTVDDGWIIYQGKVYNVTQYFRFHPGGVDELRKGLGRDATALVMKYHAWVNVETMLRKCLLGLLMPEPEHNDDDE
jgi:cytochrome-b5 reductase